MKKIIATVVATVTLATGLVLINAAPAHAGSTHNGVYADVWADCEPDGSVIVHVFAKKKKGAPLFADIYWRIKGPKIEGVQVMRATALGPGIKAYTNSYRVRPGRVGSHITVVARYGRKPNGHVMEGLRIDAPCRGHKSHSRGTPGPRYVNRF